jgi:hypothetical protein
MDRAWVESDERKASVSGIRIHRSDLQGSNSWLSPNRARLANLGVGLEGTRRCPTHGRPVESDYRWPMGRAASTDKRLCSRKAPTCREISVGIGVCHKACESQAPQPFSYVLGVGLGQNGPDRLTSADFAPNRMGGPPRPVGRSPIPKKQTACEACESDDAIQFPGTCTFEPERSRWRAAT